MGTHISKVRTQDARFHLEGGAGSDALHTDPQYAYAVTVLETDKAIAGTGFVLTLGQGNQLVTEAIELLAEGLVGMDIEELMASFATHSRAMADHPQLRWLGPHKGVVHLALASITNACFDLWAMSRGVPLWRLLLDLDDVQFASLLDLTYLEHVLTTEDVVAFVGQQRQGREERRGILNTGYPGYDTSIGWLGYDDATVIANAGEAVDRGFTALKLKVGSDDVVRDVRRATSLRGAVGPDVRVMIDANQRWSVPKAIANIDRFRDVDLFWVEEPTHPDDVNGHRAIVDAVTPVRIAVGEHVPNRVVFNNYINQRAVHFIQVDCTRVAGVSEFLTVSLLARRAGLPVVPHVGDMGQVHQHLVLFNHIALDCDVVFLEHIPHLSQYFLHPAVVEDGVYRTPQVPGSSAALRATT
jgi:L-fuconate dehydratase